MAACDRLAEKQDKVRSPLLLGMREENHLLSVCGEVVGHSCYRFPIKSPMFLLSFKLHREKNRGKKRQETTRKERNMIGPILSTNLYCHYLPSYSTFFPWRLPRDEEGSEKTKHSFAADQMSILLRVDQDGRQQKWMNTAVHTTNPIKYSFHASWGTKGQPSV